MQERAVRTRQRVLRAAAELLSSQGRAGISTRAVSAAAGVQPPTLYRLFGDKDGLLDALAAYGFQQYLREKQALEETDDPVADLRRSWDLHVGFGLSQPGFYVLMYGEGRYRGGIPGGLETIAILRRTLTRVAAAGRLRMSVERATQLVHAMGLGVVLSLIATPPSERDQYLPATAREHALRMITTTSTAEEQSADLARRAATLREALSRADTTALTPSERALLADWLDRLADASPTARSTP
ncbi:MULTISPECIES: TetR/AcrR family transcriptional regulator [unclassified Streptomyces]|uniref:TetR/AcrR family transcriptional regulator n=1 Tax=unclassified Streptomyces TaxID=2593676 RepID=UPI0033B16E4F|nr:TetR/AcrR family transcriptional regulator [Streptomyces sp. NBC_01176]